MANNIFIKQMIDWAQEAYDNDQEPITWKVGQNTLRMLCTALLETEHGLFDFDQQGLLFYDIPVRCRPDVGINGIELECI